MAPNSRADPASESTQSPPPSIAMPPRVQRGAFLLEALNSISATYYFYYVFFLLKSQFGFGNRENLVWAIAHGFFYILGSWFGGRIGQRRGYLRTIRLGLGIMAVAFGLGWLLGHASLSRSLELGLQILLMIVATGGICLTWANLEAIVSEGEPPDRLQRHIGIYNLVWSCAGAAAYFTGGALIEWLGARTLVLLLPSLLLVGQWFLATWLLAIPGADQLPLAHPSRHDSPTDDPARSRSNVSPRAFLRMAWLANPCAYLAIYAAVPQIPSLAERLGLGAAAAGVFCSLWLFVRTATFVVLWKWTRWHYRFGWLAASYVGMIVGFLFLFLSAAIPGLARGEALALATAAQVVFGVSIGLIYYSSLFYSMDVGDTKGDHGGIHEAAIGAGIMGGPLVGAVAQFARPSSATAPTWAVSAVLLLGFAVLLALRYARSSTSASDSPSRTPSDR